MSGQYHAKGAFRAWADRAEIARNEAELTLRRAERLYREARALWWATLLLAGAMLAGVVSAVLWAVL